MHKKIMSDVITILGKMQKKQKKYVLYIFLHFVESISGWVTPKLWWSLHAMLHMIELKHAIQANHFRSGPQYSALKQAYKTYARDGEGKEGGE